jgi:hypothetical protein
VASTCIGAFGLVLACAITAPVAADFQRAGLAANGHTISGRVIDPHQLHPEALTLMLGRNEGENSFGSQPVHFKADGSFVTERLDAGTYVLELVRTPHSATKPATSVGLTVVTLGNSDLSNVTLEVRRDTALIGSFKMESDDPNAAWPLEIVVNATLALEGKPFLGSAVAEGAPGGKFILRNTFGPRVLRCGYRNAPGSRWWPLHVMLDGADITNVPTDFSTHENGRLEVVFTSHSARIQGTVTDSSGQPVRAPWILAGPEEPALRQHWSTMSYVVQGNTRGEFSIAVVPGRFLIAAAPQEVFAHRDARKDVFTVTSTGMLVEVRRREIKKIVLSIRPH